MDNEAFQLIIYCFGGMRRLEQVLHMDRNTIPNIYNTTSFAFEILTLHCNANELKCASGNKKG